jgi:hypothetical protein
MVLTARVQVMSRGLAAGLAQRFSLAAGSLNCITIRALTLRTNGQYSPLNRQSRPSELWV